MLGIILFYTFILFTFIMYLLYIRECHFSKYADLKIKVTLNVERYFFYFYCSIFVLSVLFAFTTYCIELAGVQIANSIAAVMPLEGGRFASENMGVSDQSAAGLGAASSNNDVDPNKSVTPNSPSEAKKPENGSSFFGDAGRALKKKVINFYTDQAKKSAIDFSERNFPLHSHTIVKNTVNQITSNQAVPLSKLDVVGEVRIAGILLVKGPDNVVRPYLCSDLQMAYAAYKAMCEASGRGTNIGTLAEIGINGLFKFTPLGAPQAFPFPPESEKAIMAQLKSLNIETLTLSQDIDTTQKAICSAPSTPTTPTDPKNTHYPF
jgi:hypothetical protein